ncbi:MAG TPA: FlgD immunoglobulin-like domain containing protein, partial [bacterium]|nr:FlgD immunoglobulin-like domain containing protein [bacterium]
TDWTIHRKVPLGAIFPWWNFPGAFVEFDQLVKYGFLETMWDLHPQTVATKPGGTRPGQATAVFSADLNTPGDRVTATLMGVPRTESYGGSRSTLGDQLLKLVDLECNPQIKLPPGPPPVPVSLVDMAGIPTSDMSIRSAVFRPSDGEESDLTFHVERETFGAAVTSLNLAVTRTSEVELGSLEAARFGIDGFQKHAGVRILNMGATTALITVAASHPAGTLLTVPIAPEDEYFLAAYPPPVRSGGVGGGSVYELVLENASTSDIAHLTVEEIGYHGEFSLGDGTTSPSTIEQTITRSGGRVDDVVTFYVTGRDLPTGSETVRLVVGDVTTLTDVPFAGGPSEGLFLRNFPNPFTSATTIAYALPAPGPARLAVYDVTGRLVRTLAEGRRVPAGAYRAVWDGTDRTGRRVASGVYFYRLETRDATRARRVTLLR